jgi:hypothetical protein
MQDSPRGIGSGNRIVPIPIMAKAADVKTHLIVSNHHVTDSCPRFRDQTIATAAYTSLLSAWTFRVRSLDGKAAHDEVARRQCRPLHETLTDPSKLACRIAANEETLVDEEPMAAYPASGLAAVDSQLARIYQRHGNHTSVQPTCVQDRSMAKAALDWAISSR